MTQDRTTRERNRETVLAAEAQGQGRFDAYPLRVTFELTADCNLRCPHCEFTPPRAWKEKHDPKRLLHTPIEDLRRFAADIFPHIEEVIPSVVGEPMAYPHWDDWLDLLQQYGVFMELVTNGTHFDQLSLRRLGPLTSRIIVSMDGASPATFNHLRAPADFDDVCSRLEQVRSWRESLPEHERPYFTIASVLTLHWIDELPEMVRLAKRLGADEFSASHLIAYNEYWQEHHPQRNPERTDQALLAARQEAQTLDISVALPRLFSTGANPSHQAPTALPLRPKLAEQPRPEGSKHWCKYIWREAFVALNGDVSPCCGSHRPVVDNLRGHYDFKNIFMHPTLVAMREGMATGDLHPACGSCPLLSMFGDLDYAASDFTKEYGTLKGLLEKREG